MNKNSNKHIIKILQLISILLLVAITGYTQTGQNPFDITTNPVEIPIQNYSTEEDSSGIKNSPPAVSGNPFDINSSNQNLPADRKKESIDVEEKRPVQSGVKTEPASKKEKRTQKSPIKQSSNSNFLFIITILMILLFAILLTLFRSYIGKVYEGFVNNSLLNASYREMGNSLSLPYLFLYLLFPFNASIFTYLVLQYYGLLQVENHWTTFLFIFLGILAIIAIRHLILNIVAWVFPIEKNLNLYNFIIINFNIFIGIVLIPFNLLLAFGPSQIQYPVLMISIGILGLIYVYRSIRSLLVGSSYVYYNKFHFFMYLCGVEFAPLVILVKFIKNLL